MRSLAITMAVLLTGTAANVPAALAIAPPVVDPSLVPADGPPSPEQPMRQSNECARTTATADSDVSAPTPGFAMLNISKAWQ